MNTNIRDMVNRLRSLELELVLIRPEDYVEIGDYRTALARREAFINELRGQLWDATHKSRYVLARIR